jgi:DNA-binding XRE family transcriptional regulator
LQFWQGERSKLKGRELKKIRERLDMTQKALAEALGVKRLTVSTWECDRLKIQHYIALAVQSLSCPSCQRRRKRAAKKVTK